MYFCTYEVNLYFIDIYLIFRILVEKPIEVKRPGTSQPSESNQSGKLKILDL